MKGKTDWKKLKAMTEKQVIAAANLDPDALPVTPAELKKFKRVHSPKEIDVKALREKLELSQKTFADYFGVSVRTLQEWEQHRCSPNATARNFLKVIEKAPRAVQKALAA
jgi:putative transcriptional regulator